uniref:Scol-DUF3472 n=1 Tax=Hemiscolopendra marginata TaxID=943146 RepID=A0A646QFL5_9MYRI
MLLLVNLLFLLPVIAVNGMRIENDLQERYAANDVLRLSPEEGTLKGSDGISRSGDKTKFVGWTGTDAEVYWNVQLTNKGNMEIEMALANSHGNTGSTIQVKVQNGGSNKILKITTDYSGGWNQQKVFKMGSVTIDAIGKTTITVSAPQIKGVYAGDFYGLLIKGPAVSGAKVVDIFPTGADSVHLTYPTDDNALMFYNEVIVDESYPATFFMACGYQNGYLGMQEVNFSGKKLAIFSLWDVVDQERTNSDDLASVLKAGENVTIKRFGGEGTGFQSLYDFQWKVGNKYSFLLHAKPEGRYTIFTGLVYLPDKSQWKLLSSLKRLGDPITLSHFYSFLEDWIQNWGQVARQASFNPWQGDGKGNWKQLKTASFTKTSVHDNVNAWVKNSRFYLRTGGVTQNSIKPYQSINRQVSDQLPSILKDIESIIKDGKYHP